MDRAGEVYRWAAADDILLVIRFTIHVSSRRRTHKPVWETRSLLDGRPHWFTESWFNGAIANRLERIA